VSRKAVTQMYSLTQNSQQTDCRSNSDDISIRMLKIEMEI